MYSQILYRYSRTIVRRATRLVTGTCSTATSVPKVLSSSETKLKKLVDTSNVMDMAGYESVICFGKADHITSFRGPEDLLNRKFLIQ